MTSNSKIVFAFCAVPFLTACGGDGDSGLAPPTFTEMEAAQIALDALYGADAARTDVPSGIGAGTATYEGYVGGDLDDGRDLIGELELAVNFETTTVTGTADNFADSNDQTFAGSLGFSGNVQYGGDNTEADTLVGTLTGDLDADGTTYATSILLDGSEFYRGLPAETPTAVAGDASGLLDDGGLPLLFDGSFIADKP